MWATPVQTRMHFYPNRLHSVLTSIVFDSLGAYCEGPGKAWDGLPCEFDHSTCGNRTEDCHGRWVCCRAKCISTKPLKLLGRGPGFRISDFESNRIIAQYQADGASTLMRQTLPAVSGAVKYVHTYLNMQVSTAPFICASSHVSIGLGITSHFRMGPPCRLVRLHWVRLLVSENWQRRGRLGAPTESIPTKNPVVRTLVPKAYEGSNCTATGTLRSPSFHDPSTAR